MSSKKAAAISGGVGGAAAGGTLVGTTAMLTGSAANLGGYATAQIVGSSLLGVGGPGVSAGIAAVGGPLVAGTLATGGVALLAAGVGVQTLQTVELKKAFPALRKA